MSTLPLTDDEIADYGPEFLNIVRRVADHAAAPLRHGFALYGSAAVSLPASCDDWAQVLLSQIKV